MRNERVVAKSFLAKDYTKAVEHKEATGGIMTREVTPTNVIYVVRYIPPVEPIREIVWRTQHNLDKALKNWPYWIHFFTALNSLNV